MEAFYAGLPLADVHQDLARNIKSICVSQNLFDDLSDDPADWEIAQQHELATKPRVADHHYRPALRGGRLAQRN